MAEGLSKMLPIFKDDNQNFILMQNNWASQINPVLSNLLVQGQLLKDIALSSGLNVINHKLGRNYQGYLVTGMHDVFSQIYDLTSQTPSKTLNLHSSVQTSIDLWVF